MAQAGKKLFGRNGGLMAALLLALNPFHIWFSRDANFYIVVALSSTGALYFFACLLRRPRLRSWIGLTLMTGLGLWTHYFALAIPLVGFAYLAINFRRYHHLLRPWVAAQIVAVLPLAPWYVFLVQRGEFYFGSAASESPKLVDLLYTFWNFSIGYTVEYTPFVVASLVLFGGAVLLGVWRIRRENELLLPFLHCCLPIVLTFGMSFRLPMYVDRYIIVSLPAFLLLVVAGVMKAPRNWRAVWLAGLVAASMLGSLRFYYDEEYYTKEDWRGVVQYIQSQEQPGDAIMLLRIHSLLPFVGQYYHGDLPFEPILLQDTVRQPSTFADQYRRLWYVYGHRRVTHLLAKCQPMDEYSGVQQKEVRDWLKEHESDLVQREDFACISVLLYDLAGGAESGP
jgi:4-amino-4-deoxy-L-arabinose transferase-like glycosyltransferase